MSVSSGNRTGICSIHVFGQGHFRPSVINLTASTTEVNRVSNWAPKINSVSFRKYFLSVSNKEPSHLSALNKKFSHITMGV